MKIDKTSLIVAVLCLAGLHALLWSLYHRTAILVVAIYIFFGILASLRFGWKKWKYWAVVILLAVVSFMIYCEGEVDCSYCHNSNDNVKWNCVKFQREGWCDEDYYDQHYNKDSCPWCRKTGKQTRLESFLD